MGVGAETRRHHHRHLARRSAGARRGGGRGAADVGEAIRLVDDVGLLSAEVDAETGESIGNFPQAFCHIGLVNAAWAISQAEARE